MIRVQIQLPAPLEDELKNIAVTKGISFAELCRRGLERYAKQFSSTPMKEQTWEFPVLPANAMNEEEALYRQETSAVETRNE